VKALDVCNAAAHRVESVRHYLKLAEIVAAAFKQKPISDGQVWRAKKALNSLMLTLEDKEGSNKTQLGRTDGGELTVGVVRLVRCEREKQWRERPA
jgi:hypothetical protein